MKPTKVTASGETAEWIDENTDAATSTVHTKRNKAIVL